ncbi:MAG: molybdopterin oxidoreductase, partial [Candidatus Neomarinimicrobiota bacterium]
MGATKKFQQPISRRDFFKSSALLGGSGLLAETLASCTTVQQAEGWQNAYDLDSAEHVLYSVCLQCHTDCPIKVRIQNGVAVKMDGNPYGMQTMNPAIPYQTDLASSAKIDGGICPKGQAGLQSLYDPYRLTKVLKRSGKRGENKWQVISFDQAIREIVSGGKLFSHV